MKLKGEKNKDEGQDEDEQGDKTRRVCHGQGNA